MKNFKLQDKKNTTDKDIGVMEIRKAKKEDLMDILKIYEQARNFMKENGNSEQWGDVYPTQELVEQGMDKTYLCMEADQIACVFYYAQEEDKAYQVIEGKWLNEKPYAVVHRVASTGIVRGAAAYCLNWAYEQIPNIRMDTYKDNIPMQKLLEKCGFVYCGTFEQREMKGWMAYHKV